MYRFVRNINSNNNGGGEWVKFREISTNSSYCYTMNYYYDEVLSKTYVFFGFTNSFIKIYNLKENSFDAQKQFKTTSHVSSINFIVRCNKNNNSIKNLQQIMHPQYHLKKEQQQNKNKTQTNEIIMDRFIIYTQWNNSIIIGDINTGNIIRECAIPNVSYNYDLCIWNKLPPSLIPHNENINVNEKALMLNSNNNNMSYYLIVASYDNSNNHSINILNFEDLSVILTKKAININDKSSYPSNLLKTKVSSYLSENEKILEESKKEGKGVGSSKFPSNAQEQKYKEVIVQFNYGYGDYSSIYLFE